MAEDPRPPAAPAPARIRACFVIDRLAGRGGGAERILIETANALAARGHEIQIVSHESQEGAPFYPLAFGVMHINLNRPKAVRNRLRRRLDALRARAHARYKTLPPPLDRLLWQSKYGAFHRRLEQHLEAHRPDVAIAFLPPAITALGRITPPGGMRRVASLHNVPEQDLTNPARWDPSPLDRRRRSAALAAHDTITVLLPEFRDWFAPDLQAKITVLPNPVPQVPARQVAEARREKVVLSVGRLAPVKRHDVLIEAWARLAREHPDWELRIFGTGPLRRTLGALIAERGLKDRVRLMGQTDAIGAEYLAASILCHPAEYEGWGLAVTEALAAGLVPVGFADCPGVNQLIETGRNGILVAPGSDRIGALAAALSELMAEPDLRETLGADGPRSVAAYAPDRVIDLWERILTGGHDT